ncbi:MAG: cell division protein FtsZ [Candidatus Jorgensenbacteria bacterium]
MKKHRTTKTKTQKAPKARTAKNSAERTQKKKFAVAHIKVVGVGGGGGNIISRMMGGADRIRGVEFIAVNTDAQDLDHALAHRKIYIGRALTRGLGAGMNVEVGRQAAEENRSEIGEALEGADIVFVTAGFGGGTGTAVAPVVAEIAHEKGILTIGVVTKPFAFEGAQRAAIAQEGLARFREKVDALVVIPNDRIFSVIDKETPLMRAFGYIDDVLKNAVKAITELISAPGIINVDFADIRTTLKDAGAALIGIGIASGQDRAAKAVDAALNSPLLEVSIDGAKGVLFSIAGGRDVKMEEINEIAKAISANVDTNARVIFGAYHDRGLPEKSIKITVIATGFNGAFGSRAQMPSLFVSQEAPHREPPPHPTSQQKEKPFPTHPPAEEEKGKEKASKTRAEKEKEESWEIPAFLRKKRK